VADHVSTPKDAANTPGGENENNIGYGAVFSVREFRPIFAAHVLSLLGVVLAEVALAVLVFAETGSAVLSALVFALTYLPYALSGLLLSGIADRYPARRVLVGCDVLSCACVAAMAIPGTPIAVLFALRVAMSLIAPASATCWGGRWCGSSPRARRSPASGWAAWCWCGSARATRCC
jgi:MFS family permease